MTRVERYRPFPVDALPHCLRGLVLAVAGATGTDPAFAALAVLVVIAGCVGNRVGVLVKSGWVEPAVLWGVLVGRSGTTKSPVLKNVLAPLYETYKGERRVFTQAMREHQHETERYGVRLQEWKKAQRDGPPTDPPEEPQPPVEKRVVVSDTTIEKLGCLLAENPLGLLLVRDELAAWVGGFDRYAAGGKGTDCPAWLSMFDAGTITIDRKSAPNTLFVERAAVSVLGSIQPGTLTRAFGRAEREAGLLARVLLAYPPDRPALWTDAELPDDVTTSWKDLLVRLLELEPARDDAGDLRPRLIPFSPEARGLWIGWHNRHVRDSVNIENEDLAAHFAKLKGLCARFALLITCTDVASGGLRAASISADAVRRATTIVEWFKYEARRVYAMLSESGTEREVRQLIELIHRRGGRITPRELRQYHRRFRDSGDAAEGALQQLVNAGVGTWEQVTPGSSGGRPTRLFVLSAVSTVYETMPKTERSESFVDVDAVDGTVTDAGMGCPEGEQPPDDVRYAHIPEGQTTNTDDWGDL